MIDIVVISYNDTDNVKALIARFASEQKFNRLIVVDAASDICALAEIRAHANNTTISSKVDCYSCDRPSSAGEARNFGASKSCSDYVAFIDADDNWEQMRLQNLEGILRDYDVIVGQYLTVNEQNKSKLRSNKNKILTLSDHVRGQSFCASSIIVKRGILNKFPFWSKRREDFEWMLRLLSKGYLVYYDRENIVYWNYKSNISHVKRKLPRLIDQYNVYRIYFNPIQSAYFWLHYFIRAVRNWSK